MLGFKVMRPLALGDWKVLTADGAVPFAVQQFCPADADVALETLAVLSGENGKRNIRIGFCPACGYMGFIDRPTEAWIADFYSSGMWDRAEGGGDKKSARRIARMMRGDLGTKNDTVRMIEGLALDHARPVLEIGCGYGESLGFLKRAGYQRLAGIEHSPRRAEVAGRTLGMEIAIGQFEAPAMRTMLARCAPFGLIFSHHTLEHVYDPARFIGAAAELQAGGDYLVLSVPHGIGESSVAVLMFLPHLHSFSLASLARLLARFGYRVIDTSLTSDRVLNIVARKEPPDGSRSPMAAAADIRAILRRKIIRGLGIDGTLRPGLRRLWWHKKADSGGQVSFLKNPILEAAHGAIRACLVRCRRGAAAPDRTELSLLIAPRAARGGEDESPDMPIEIQFDGPPLLFYK